MGDDDGFKSSVYFEEEEIDNTTGLIRHRRVVPLKGQEPTEDLLKLAKAEMERE